MSGNFIVSNVSGAEWLEKIAQFRFEVWKANNMIDLALFPEQKCLEEIDHEAIQIVIESNGQLVAASRYISYPDLYSTHHGDYYKQASVVLEGRVGIPEHTVVRPDMVRKGLHNLIVDEVFRLAKEVGATYTVSECTPAAARLLRKRGRKSLGMAPLDPRFPGIEFEWMVSDVTELNRK
ncbi:MAG: hypothetical protein GKR91_07045 [Pseudomonadales bacterium]|nr:hypothetical protein [Pseudomonadales bacterium]